MAGHTTAARSVASVVTTNTSTAITAPAGSFFVVADVGAPISGTGIPANATLAAVASGTAATLSAAASASGTITATVGPSLPTAAGFVGFIPDATQSAWSFASVAAGTAAPEVLTDSVTRVSQPTGI